MSRINLLNYKKKYLNFNPGLNSSATQGSNQNQKLRSWLGPETVGTGARASRGRTWLGEEITGAGDGRGKKGPDTWMAVTRGGGDRKKRPELGAAKLDAARAGDGRGRSCLGQDMAGPGNGRIREWVGLEVMGTGSSRDWRRPSWMQPGPGMAGAGLVGTGGK